jgi:HK97 family phage portal protein
MGLFDFLRSEKRGDNGKTYLLSQLGLTGGARTGVRVDENTALTFSAVYACVRVLSESVASLPVHVMKREANGNVITDRVHPVYKLISKSPNKVMTSYTWRQSLIANLVLQGNSYYIIKRDNSARPVELIYVNPEDVQVKYLDGEVFYDIKNYDQPFTADNILHFLGLGYDGLKGKSVIELHRDTIGLSIAANQYGGSFYGNAATPSGILKHPGKLSKEAAERLRNSWNNKYGNGPSNSHRTAILEEGMEFKPISMSPQDADFLNTRKFQIAEIARLFRVPPHMIQDLDRATYSNIEQQSIDFVMHTLRPYLINLEEEMNRKLFRENEQDSYYIKFNVGGLLRGDSEARSKYYREMSSIGVLSINEIRRLEELNDIGEAGDQHYYPMNFQPITDGGK